MWSAGSWSKGHGGAANRGAPYRNGGKGRKDTSKGRGKGARPLQPGEFDLTSGAAIQLDAEIVASVSYSYVSKSGSLDVASPAWSVRSLLPLPSDGTCSVDLSLERCLASLQAEDGGFDLTAELVTALGLENAGRALKHAEDSDERVVATLLALKTVDVFKGTAATPILKNICARAEVFACEALGLDTDAFRSALDSIGEDQSIGSAIPLPDVAESLLSEAFHPHGRWSFFELWERLLPEETLCALRDAGGLLCPRFFLVDLGSATSCPFDINRSFPLIRSGARLYVGQPPGNAGGVDSMRQGRQLEAALVTFAEVEEDHILSELILPGVRAVYSAAPDAVEDGGKYCAEEPLPPGDDAAYADVGYKLTDSFPHLTGRCNSCRIWRAPDRKAAPAEAFVEVKKTTHLKGAGGRFKLLKFWLQAALMRCGAVVVATTDGSSDGDRVCRVHRYPLAELEAQLDVRKVWGTLARMLHHILRETDADGKWTLHIEKGSGMNTPVRLSVRQGWDEEWDGGGENILDRVSMLFSENGRDQDAGGEDVEGDDFESWMATT